eukprot:m.182485 g.182485  ORF g.182485 m.182485 type:complete len:105 (-) comp18064_c0_seq2:761-1075(-)
MSYSSFGGHPSSSHQDEPVRITVTHNEISVGVNRKVAGATGPRPFERVCDVACGGIKRKHSRVPMIYDGELPFCIKGQPDRVFHSRFEAFSGGLCWCFPRPIKF